MFAKIVSEKSEKIIECVDSSVRVYHPSHEMFQSLLADTSCVRVIFCLGNDGETNFVYEDETLYLLSDSGKTIDKY